MKSFRSVDENGTIRYTNENGDLHRLNGPAFEEPGGFKMWYINGLLHREDGPAAIWDNGDGYYFLDDIEYTKEEWEEELFKRKLKRIKDL